MTTASHFAKVETSQRLQEVAKVLADGLWHSSLEISQRTNSVAAHSDCHELRQNGYRIEQRYNGLTPNGRRVSEYRKGVSIGEKAAK